VQQTVPRGKSLRAVRTIAGNDTLPALDWERLDWARQCSAVAGS